MADATLTQATRLIDFAPPGVTEKLFKLQVGGCTCMTETPELRFHDARCTYRLACEIQDLLNTAAPPSPPVAAPAEPVHWRAVLDPEQVPQQANPRLHALGFYSEKSADAWIAEQLDFEGWRYTKEPLYAAPQPPRPGTAPLSDEQIVMDGLMMVPTTVCGDMPAVFEAGVRFAERAHGIGPTTPTKD